MIGSGLQAPTTLGKFKPMVLGEIQAAGDTRRTCPGSHIPRRVAVGTPRLLSSVAVPYHEVMPLARISATMAASCDARASARAILTLRPASPAGDFPVTAMASRGKTRTEGAESKGKLANRRAASTNYRLRGQC